VHRQPGPNSGDKPFLQAGDERSSSIGIGTRSHLTVPYQTQQVSGLSSGAFV
jgi:hypothetical protein